MANDTLDLNTGEAKSIWDNERYYSGSEDGKSVMVGQFMDWHQALTSIDEMQSDGRRNSD